jgi:hypothetical protein
MVVVYYLISLSPTSSDDTGARHENLVLKRGAEFAAAIDRRLLDLTANACSGTSDQS